MKITCELCGGALQVNPGGQDAACLNCGLIYSMERLREMLTGNTSITPESPKPDDEIIYDIRDWEKADSPQCDFAYKPEQFVMEARGDSRGNLCGLVQQGGIGLGDSVYIDGDYAHPYKVFNINGNSCMTSAKAGMSAELYLATCPRKIRKNARIVTGDPSPVANAYNYPGTVQEYFSHLLSSAFGEYEIRRDVSREGVDIPVHYLFCRGGRPVLAVFLIHSNDKKACSQMKKAERIFPLEGVSCTHFYENYRNDAPYVIDRVRGVLG